MLVIPRGSATVVVVPVAVERLPRVETADFLEVAAVLAAATTLPPTSGATEAGERSGYIQ